LAINQFKVNLELAEALGLTREVAVALNNIGEAERRRGRYADALIAMKAALELLQKNKDRQNEAKSHLNLGVFYYETGEPLLARDHWRLAGKIAGEVGDPVAEASAFSNLGCLSLAIGEYGDARAALTYALKIDQEAKQFQREILDVYNLARLDAKQ